MTKEKDECYGCGRPWKEPSLFCPMCQDKGIPSSAGGLIESVAKFKPGTEMNNLKYTDACGKCGAPNTVTPVGWFCKSCSDAMDLSDKIRKQQGR